MKVLKYLSMLAVAVLLASCMGADYADPKDTGESPYGNNALEETNLLTIAELKAEYASVIRNNGMKKIEGPKQIKGVVISSDASGNIYNQISVQDETGAMIICIAQGGIYGYLPVGQEVLVELEDLYIGAYGQQPQIGVPYTSASGSTYVSRMSRMLWNKHYKLIGKAQPEKVEPMEFDKSKITDANYMEEHCGKLMTIRNVTFENNQGTPVFAPTDGTATVTANAVNRTFVGIKSSNLVLRTSTYANFANDPLPEGPVDITGIFTRFNNTWQILLLSTDGIKPAATAIFSETFAESLGDFTIRYLIPKASELSYIWAWDARFGARASAFLNDKRYESDAWLISPSIDLSKVNDAILSFDQAQKYAQGGGIDIKVMISSSYTDGSEIVLNNWTELTLDKWPTGENWDFITSSVNIKNFCGNSNVHFAFRYMATPNVAATWEIKNVQVK